MSKEQLRKSPLFSGLNEEDLQWLYDSAQRVPLAPGDPVMGEGEAADAAYLVLAGDFEVTKRSGDREFVIDRRSAGDFMGEIALLENARRTATVRALTRAEVLEVKRDTFHELLRRCPDAALTVLQAIAGRLRHTEVTLRQSEKMATLGTLSAGLAHELNNPAAAIQRSAKQLRDALTAVQRCTGDLAAQRLSAAQSALIDDLRGQIPARLAASDDRGALERGDAEAELQEWLEEQGLDEAWDVAPSIVAAGWNESELAALTGSFSASQRVALVRWLASAVVAHALVETMSQGAQRIANIVTAVKSYAYLDRGPVQLLDVHEGLDNTLAILEHKLGEGVEVVREYDRDLPRIEAYGGELNQVWTNIIDNAIDAVAGRGVIRIRTAASPNAAGAPCVVVEVTDDGPGIPAALQERIFDAFFTTKEPGHGTGLGLHISYNIIVNQHRGEVAVASRPGQTTFKISLPVRLAEN